ncbi:MAG: hypothetical protein QW381_02595 [Thermofilaceae archaeon]
METVGVKTIDAPLATASLTMRVDATSTSLLKPHALLSCNPAKRGKILSSHLTIQEDLKLLLASCANMCTLNSRLNF